MSLAQGTLHEIADMLGNAEAKRIPIPSLRGKYQVTLEDAYQIQMMNAAKKLKQGRHLAGYKVGLTSREAQQIFQVFEPDFGHLFDSMHVLNETELDLSTLIQPKIEGEIAFVLGRDLDGPGVTAADAARAVDSVMGAFEIVDSRFENWKITATDTISDNGSSALYCLTGKPVSVQGLDLVHLGMALSRNGEVSVTACGGAVMGNPIQALVFLANALGKSGRSLTAGEVVLSGSLGGMIPMKPGEHYSCEFLELGSVTLTTKRGEK